jgi:ABC-type multidrug transport system fused ATPase/permease subunit
MTVTRGRAGRRRPGSRRRRTAWRVTKEEKSLRDVLAPNIRPMLIVRARARDLPADRRDQHRHLLRTHDPHVHRLEAKSAITQALFIGVTNVVFTIVAVLLLDKVGRRIFLLAGTATLTVALVLLGIFYFPSLQDSAPHLGLAALLLYIAGFAIADEAEAPRHSAKRREAQRA